MISEGLEKAMDKDRRQAVERNLNDRNLKILLRYASIRTTFMGWIKGENTASGRGMEPHDILDEAIARIFEERRKTWDGSDQTFICYAKGVIKSVVSGHKTSEYYRVENGGAPDDKTVDTYCRDALESSAQPSLPDGDNVFNAAYKMMEGDEQAQLWILASEAGYTREDISKECGMQLPEVDNARTRVIYRMRQRYTQVNTLGKFNDGA
jgi:hypothetical protein